MLTCLPRTVAFTTRRGMATYRKVREPYDLKKRQRPGPNRPSFLQTKSRQYAPVDSTTSFGLRAPEKEPWKPDDDRFDTSMAREVDKPIGGALRQHLVVRPGRKDRDATVAGSETRASPESHSQGECKSFLLDSTLRYAFRELSNSRHDDSFSLSHCQRNDGHESGHAPRSSWVGTARNPRR